MLGIAPTRVVAQAILHACICGDQANRAIQLSSEKPGRRVQNVDIAYQRHDTTMTTCDTYPHPPQFRYRII